VKLQPTLTREKKKKLEDNLYFSESFNNRDKDHVRTKSRPMSMENQDLTPAQEMALHACLDVNAKKLNDFEELVEDP
jgi:hypothetical protein